MHSNSEERRAVTDRILRNTRTIAVVGLSESPGRASAGVARYLQQAGYRTVPVNPAIEKALGEQAYPSLDAACEAFAQRGIGIDLVDVFRASAFVPEIVKDMIRLKIPALWLQLGVSHEEAEQWATHAGIEVVADRCIMLDHVDWQRGSKQ